MLPILAALLLAAAPAFGPYDAENLKGDVVRVPDRLPGTVRLLLVAFERDRAEALDLSYGRLMPLEREIVGLTVFQTPVIGRVNGVVQAMVLGTQRLFVPEERRARFVPLFVDRKEAMAALGVTDVGACVALLMQGATVRAILADACAPDLPGRARAAVASLGATAPLPAGP